jgi:hypothetical protein
MYLNKTIQAMNALTGRFSVPENVLRTGGEDGK